MSENKENQSVKAVKGQISKADHQRELKHLSERLEKAGYCVRREQLKQGFGWKTVSGMCRLNSDRLILVDRKLPIEEQIVFLRTVLAQQ